MTRATYSVPEVARLLGISRNSAYQAIERGELPAVRFGRLLKVPKVAIEKMLSQTALTKDAA